MDGGITPASPLSPRTLLRVYKARWWMLAMFSLCTLTNAVLWITFAPIQTIVSQRFGVDSTAVNFLSLSYMILYLPGTILSSKVTSKHGLRANMLCGCACNALASALRCLACTDIGLDRYWSKTSFAILMLGQCIAALGQPCFTNAPARLAGEWFAIEQRDLATTVAAIFNPLGNAVGQVLPPLLVSHPSQLIRVQLACAGLSGIGLLLVALFFKSAPELAPSRSASAKRLVRAQSIAAGLSDWDMLRRDAGTLLRDGNFIKLMIGFGIGLGFFNSLLTVIEQLLSPCGYGSTAAGACGGAVIGAGLVGAAIAGPLMDKTHAYRATLKGGIALVAGGSVFMLASLRPGNVGMVVASFAVTGLAMLPMLPISLQNAVECTYPIPEESSAAMLLLTGQYTGIVFTLVLTRMLKHETCHTVYTPTAAFIVAVIVVAAVPIALFNGQYKRLEADEDARQEALLLPGDGGTPIHVAEVRINGGRAKVEADDADP